MSNTTDENLTKNQKFIRYVFDSINKNKGIRAAFRKADNEDTESYAWEYLAKWCDLDNEKDRKTFALIGACIARTKASEGQTKIVDGVLDFGHALFMAYSEKDGKTFIKEDDFPAPAKSRLKRLLNCNSTLEVIGVLRPMLRLLNSKDVSVSYEKLLKDLICFNHDIKINWARDFYSHIERSEK